MLKSILLGGFVLSFSALAQSVPTEVQCCAEFDLAGEASDACKNILPDTSRCKIVAAEQSKIKSAAVNTSLKESRNKTMTLVVQVLAALFLIVFLAKNRMNKKSHLDHLKKVKGPSTDELLARRNRGYNRGNFEK